MAMATASAGAKHGLDTVNQASFVSLEHARIAVQRRRLAGVSGAGCGDHATMRAERAGERLAVLEAGGRGMGARDADCEATPRRAMHGGSRP